MEQIYLFATQTAQAQGGQPPAAPPEAQETPSADAPPTTEEAPPPAETEPTQAPAEPPPAQPTAPVVDVPPPTPGLPASYTLKGGEFPYCIARRFNVNPGELLRLNGLNSYSVFYTGMTLKIPQTGRPFPGNRSLRPHPATYTVRAGDTIYKIACAFGDVSPDAIAAANGLAKPYNLSPGQVLNIP
jgi:LysM repeat protein